MRIPKGAQHLAPTGIGMVCSTEVCQQWYMCLSVCIIKNPLDIAIDSDNVLFVCDDQIVIFYSTGVHLGLFGERWNSSKNLTALLYICKNEIKIFQHTL